MTKDLAILTKRSYNVLEGRDYLNTEDFMDKVNDIFKEKWIKESI